MRLEERWEDRKERRENKWRSLLEGQRSEGDSQKMKLSWGVEEEQRLSER